LAPSVAGVTESLMISISVETSTTEYSISVKLATDAKTRANQSVHTKWEDNNINKHVPHNKKGN